MRGRAGRHLGGEAKASGRAYFTGGATAVLLGWRAGTIDVNVGRMPERDELLRALPRVEEELQLNIELASPLDFIPVPAGWEDRSPFVAREGVLSFHHFDPYAQALAKVERPLLYRYPAIDPASFRRAVERAFG